MYYCFVDLEKAFDRAPRKVIESALRKKGVEEKLVQTVIRLYEGARTRVRVDSEVSEPSCQDWANTDTYRTVASCG